ncbi:hypothetical protein HY990_00525 [Candidatus Micrarchaeota archaeon]|nr:hypothetical protein [Candidatus Micrarchaeota archaeon]
MSFVLGNYLVDLLDSDDKKESSLYLNNAGWLVREIWCDLLLYSPNFNQTRLSLSIALGISNNSGALYAYKNNRKAISIETLLILLYFWKHCLNKSDADLHKRLDEFFYREDWTLSTHSKNQKTRVPKVISPKLAYLMGWMVGDGHLKKSHNYLVKLSEKSTDQLNFVLKPLFKELFDINVPIFRRYKNGYALQVGSKPIYRFFKNVLQLKTGKIPDLVWHFDALNKRYFLMGVFDAEGHVICSSTCRRVAISQKDPVFLEQLRIIGSSLGVLFNSPVKHVTRLGVWYSINLGSTVQTRNFASHVGSLHVEKSKKLEKLVTRIGSSESCRSSILYG